MRSLFRILVLGITIPLFAVGPQFLAVPASAVEMSSLNTPWQNPAMIASLGSRPNLGISYGSWLGDSRTFSFQLAGTMRGGSAALRLRYLGLDDLELRTNRPTDEPLANFSAYGAALETVYNRIIGSTRIGLGFKLLRFQVYTAASQGWAVDLGIERRIGTRYRVGFSVLNLGNISLMEKSRPVLPQRVLADAGYSYGFREVTGEVSALGEVSSSVNDIILGVGNELYYKNLAARFTFKLTGEVRTYSGGISLQFGIYSFGYSLQVGNQYLGLPQIMDVSIRLP